MSRNALANLRVMVVDDSRCMRDILKAILTGLGVRTINFAQDGSSALGLIGPFRPHIVFLDWDMAPMPGIDFVRRIRTAEDSPNRYVPIVMVTSHNDVAHVSAARDSGVTEFLAKPISAKAVYTRLYTVIEHPRPFIRSETYFGPDRRRQERAYAGPDRRGASVVMV